MLRAPGVRQGSEALSARAARALLLAAALALGCRRAQPEPKGELAGAWLREPELATGFELRADGSLAFLNLPQLSGLAWNASRGELVLSTNDAAHVGSNVARLALEKLTGDALELAGDDPRFAGTYRRGAVEHVRGVLTYRERIALPPSAHVEIALELAGAGPVALAVWMPESQVPIGFDLSVLASQADKPVYALRARIADRERTLFTTPQPVAVRAGESAEVLLRFGR